MSAIEPNLIPLLWFAMFWTIACVAFLVLIGTFPLASRPDLAGRPVAVAMAFGNLLLLGVLVAGTVWFGYCRLRWTSLVLAGGVVMLFAPAAFQAWPARWRDGPVGLALLSCVLGGSVALLQLVRSALPVAT